MYQRSTSRTNKTIFRFEPDRHVARIVVNTRECVAGTIASHLAKVTEPITPNWFACAAQYEVYSGVYSGIPESDELGPEHPDSRRPDQHQQ